MKLTDARSSGVNTVRSYNPGEIKVGETVLTQSCLISPSALIADWRRAWGQGDFPFLFVQLAPYRYGPKDPAECAELREAQLKTLSAVKNTGMVVTTDIGNVKDIHPRNKQEVGRRLALWALATVYGKPGPASGPLPGG